MPDFMATLKRGHTYTLSGVKYEYNVPKRVDGATRDYLLENAVDHVSTDDKETITRAKFSFEEITKEDAVTRARPSKDAK